MRSARPCSATRTISGRLPAFLAVDPLADQVGWPLCAAYSAINWVSAQCNDISPHSSLTKIVSSGRPQVPRQETLYRDGAQIA